LIYKFGFAGAVVGTSVSLVVASGYFMSLFYRSTGYSFARVLRESYLKTISCSVLVLSVILTVRPVRSASWFGLAGTGAVFAAFYGVAILLSRFLDEYDWMKIESLVPMAKHVRKVSLVA
jgi:O-antigen/teichoic acid export membrane protein